MRRILPWPKGYFRWDLDRDEGPRAYDHYTDGWSFYRLNVHRWFASLFWLPYCLLFAIINDGWTQWIFWALLAFWMFLTYLPYLSWKKYVRDAVKTRREAIIGLRADMSARNVPDEVQTKVLRLLDDGHPDLAAAMASYYFDQHRLYGGDLNE